MNKGLEAFYRFRTNVRFDTQSDYYLSTKYLDDNDIIETELKEKEEHEKILKYYDFSLVNFREACFTLAQFRGEGFTGIENKLKALEIIKEKMVIPAYIVNTTNVEKYNKWLKQITFKKDYLKRKLTQEEYGLLKEYFNE